MDLSGIIKRAVKDGKKRAEPLWKGPEVDGITYSLLSRFLVCRERFRLLVVEGLRPKDEFNHRLEYGQMWHVCEEALASNSPHKDHGWEFFLVEYCKGLCKKYPTSQEQIDNWYGICKTQFPAYVSWWSKHPDVVARTPLLQEQVFSVPCQLPSGRTVKLRGKLDSVDLIGKGNGAGIYLQENKTKSRVDERQLKRQLTFDLQTMLYLVALERFLPGFCSMDHGLAGDKPPPILGVRYNVVKRPAQYRGKKETAEGFRSRLSAIIADSPQDFFMRFKVEVTTDDIAKFRRQCLDPILEQLCDWWEWIGNEPDPFQPDVNGNICHWRHPFGVWNVLDEGGSSELDEHLATGSTVGLERAERLFEELS